MTERPEGTPDAAPAEPEAPPEPETEIGAPGAAAAATEELEAEAGAYEPESDDAEVDEIEAELEAVKAATDELAEDELEDDELDEDEDETAVPLGVEPAAPLVAATGTAVSRRRGAPAPSVQRAPTQSELAVRVTDNASRLFVIGTVVARRERRVAHDDAGTDRGAIAFGRAVGLRIGRGIAITVLTPGPGLASGTIAWCSIARRVPAANIAGSSRSRGRTATRAVADG